MKSQDRIYAAIDLKSFYASVECVEPEELDEDERLARRRAYLEKEFGSEK